MTRVVQPGLYPSSTLYPSETLYPVDTIDGGAPISPHKIWLATAGVNVLADTSGWVEFGEGVSYSNGRTSQFEDVSPGTLTFTLNNSDGRFTPENPLSPLPVKLVEGMAVAWQLGDRLKYFRITSMEVPADEASWHHLVVTADDMLGLAGRHAIVSLADGLLEAADAKLIWRLDESEDANGGAEANLDGLGPFTLTRSNNGSTVGGVEYGVQQVDGLPGTAVTVSAAPGETNWYGTRHGNTNDVSAVQYPSLTAGAGFDAGIWNFWVYPGSTINFAVVPKFGTDRAGYNWSWQVQCTPSTYTVKPGTAAGYTYNLSGDEQQRPHYISVATRIVWQTVGSYWALFTYLYVDGFYKSAAAWYDPQHGYQIPGYLGSLNPVEVSFAVTTPPGAAAPLSGTVQRVSYAPKYGGNEYKALVGTLEGRRIVLDSIATDVNTAVYTDPLDTSPIGFPDVSNATVLDIANDIIRTEGGHLFVRSVGPITGSITYLEFRARDRPTIPDVTFDAVTEASGYPTFIRDITNVATSVEVSGPTNTATVTDKTAGAGLGRYVTSGQSETVLYRDIPDLTTWGQDRINRGVNRAIRTQQFTVDAANTPTDRSADLLTLVAGDRIRLTGLPSDRLGFAMWDGWLLGTSEQHTPTSNSFTFQLQPVTPDPAVADTALYAAGGDVILGNPYNATATSIVVNTYNGLTMSTETPYTIQIDTEQLTVTAVSGSTLTVTRGVNGTTAASHTVNTAVEIVPTAIYGY